jgi:hypothetical protein
MDICVQFNVQLKLSKCHIVSEVEFFGYKCSHRKYALTDARKAAVTSIPFSNNVREVQSAMGCANMFLRFVPQYADLATRINEMASKKINWDKTT